MDCAAKKMFSKSNLLSSVQLIKSLSKAFRTPFHLGTSAQSYYGCCYSTAQMVKPATPIKLFKITNEATNTDELFSANGKVIVFGVPVSVVIIVMVAVCWMDV